MIWKPIKGYEGLYEVSNTGLVRSCINNISRRKRILKHHIKNGYLAINLYDKKCKHYYIHRLVAEHFIDNPLNLKYVNHIDCDKHNNKVENLEWCTQKQNIEHSILNGLQHRRFKTIVDGVEYETMKDASKKAFYKNYNIVSLLHYKLGNEFTYNGKQVKVVM